MKALVKGILCWLDLHYWDEGVYIREEFSDLAGEQFLITCKNCGSCVII